MFKSLRVFTRLSFSHPTYLARARFGGGHHHEVEYDWREDPKVNKDLVVDIRDVGWHPEHYTFPYEAPAETWLFNGRPADFNNQDLTLNYRPENKSCDINYNAMRAPYWNPPAEVAHEADYESEDLDFQPEDFKTQHFRKRGPLLPWFFVGMNFFIYFWAEFILQHYPDDDHWRISILPPLDYPDTDDTDDTETYNDYHTRDGRHLVDSGIVGELWFDIVNKKKIVKPWAGVGQPMHDY